MPGFLLVGEGEHVALGDNGGVAGDDALGAVFGKGKEGIWVSIVEVVEEDAADAPSLASMLDEKVVIAAGFEGGIKGRVVVVADHLEDPVEVGDVFVEEVAGGEVDAASEPPGTGLAAVAELEIAEVGVDGGGHGVVGVEDEADAGGPEGAVADGDVPFAHGRGGGGGQGAEDGAHVHACFFEDPAVLEDAAATASASGSSGMR